jgi:hypothetical protein
LRPVIPRKGDKVTTALRKHGKRQVQPHEVAKDEGPTVANIPRRSETDDETILSNEMKKPNIQTATEEGALESSKQDKGTAQPGGDIDGPDHSTAQDTWEKSRNDNPPARQFESFIDR